MHPDTYEGGIESWGGGCISGWAYSTSSPDATLLIDIEVNGKLVETILAGRFREDLFLAKKGNGKHAFKSGVLGNKLKNDGSVDVIQILLSGTDLPIHTPIYLRRGQEITLKCYYPWTTLNVGTNGDAYPCISRSWFKDGAGLVGNQNLQSLEEIWNSPAIRKIRNDFMKGDYAICKADVCPFLNGDFQMKAPSRSVIAAISYPDRPFDAGINELVHEVDRGCNLNCVMCRPEREEIDKRIEKKVVGEIESMVKQGDLRSLVMSPAGEVLMHQKVIRMLKSNLLSDHGVHVTIITNLTLLNPALWRSIKHNDITISASIDGVCKETYERIRRGATWETVYGNLLYLADVYKRGELRKLAVNMVVMGSNRHDIGGMIELTKTLGIALFFIKHEGLSALEENVFDSCRIDILDEIYDEMDQNQGFELPHVHLGSVRVLMDRSYRSFEYRMSCARIQMSRYNRLDIAKRIVKQCVADIRSGKLEINESVFEQHHHFIRTIQEL